MLNWFNINFYYFWDVWYRFSCIWKIFPPSPPHNVIIWALPWQLLSCDNSYPLPRRIILASCSFFSFLFGGCFQRIRKRKREHQAEIFSTFLETGSCRHSLPANKGELWYLILGPLLGLYPLETKKISLLSRFHCCCNFSHSSTF